MNDEQKALAEKILAQVEIEPESLYMGAWVTEGNEDRYNWKTDEAVGGCGTTRCIAGWAIHFAAKPGEGRSDRMTRRRIAQEAGLEDWSYTHVGAHLLGLSKERAEWLFIGASENEAVDALRSMIDES
jgi:uncharacterized low-complexity protein